MTGGGVRVGGVSVFALQGIAISQAEGDEVAMETDVNSRQACLALFWKFTREVRSATSLHGLVIISQSPLPLPSPPPPPPPPSVPWCRVQVLVRMQQYKDDLLASCLHLLLSLPIELVRCQDLLEGLGPMLQVGWVVGLGPTLYTCRWSGIRPSPLLPREPLPSPRPRSRSA